MATDAAEAAAPPPPAVQEHPHEHLLRLGACGRVAPARYEDQLQLKLERLRALFGDGGADGGSSEKANGASSAAVPLPERIQVFRSAPSHYRMRADFQVWFERSSKDKKKLEEEGGDGKGGAAANDDFSDLYFIMHERVPVEPEEASESDDEAAGAAGADAQQQPPSKRPRRAFRKRRSQRAGASAPAGLHGNSAAEQQQQQQFRMQRVRVDDFPAGSRLINALMRLLREKLLQSEPLRRRLFQANFQTALSGEAMLTLVYHRALDEEWEREAKDLRAWLMARLGEEEEAARQAGQPAVRCTNLQLMGRCRGKRIDLDRNWIEEVMVVRPLALGDEWREEDDDDEEKSGGDPQQQQQQGGRAAREGEEQCVFYRQVEMSFSQPNAGMCRKMLGWALDVTRPPPKQHEREQQHESAAAAAAAPAPPPSPPDHHHNHHPHDLLELYCGNGNFSVPLARNFRRVLATEVSATSVDAARHNAHKNGLAPPPPPPANADGNDGQPPATDPPARLFVARLSAEEFSETWRTGGTRRRLEGLGGGGGLAGLDLRTVLVDPPRAGLDDLTRALLLDKRFKSVVYVSCNPVTLKRDLALLTSAEGVAEAWGKFCGGGEGAAGGSAGGGEAGKAGAEAGAAAPLPSSSAPPPPYRIERFAAFDQFPYTEHLECGAYLVRD